MHLFASLDWNPDLSKHFPGSVQMGRVAPEGGTRGAAWGAESDKRFLTADLHPLLLADTS